MPSKFNHELIEKLIQQCSFYMLPSKLEVVLNEPYIPFIPKYWNGILVLAEAQNLGATNADYVNDLKCQTPQQRICRLKDVENVGVQPWDDGSLKIALSASLNVNPLETAISNAALWSQVDGNKNLNPSKEVIHHSVDLWSQMLPVLRPKLIITSGNVARDIISNALKISDIHISTINWRLPSKNAMSRISGMFDLEDILDRYPKVNRVFEQKPEWFEAYKQNKIFFACHAVSISKYHNSHFPLEKCVTSD